MSRHASEDGCGYAADNRQPQEELARLAEALAEGLHKAMCFGPPVLHNRLACERPAVYLALAEAALAHPAARDAVPRLLRENAELRTLLGEAALLAHTYGGCTVAFAACPSRTCAAYRAALEGPAARDGEAR